MSLDLAGAATLEIGRLPQPVLTEYELGRLLFDLYDKKQVEGQKIGRLKKSVPDTGDFGSLLRTLLNRGILRKRRDFRGVCTIFWGRHSSRQKTFCARWIRLPIFHI